MPYLPTPNVFLEQSSLLLEAYPDNTRITTKYSFPKPSNKNDTHKVSKRKPTATTTNNEDSTTTTQTTTFATLTLKTYNPVTGICLKYKTNKAAEVGRLISGLGKLGAGVKITSATEESAATATADVEMAEAPGQGQAAAAAAAAAPAPAPATPAASGGGGGGKKKKGKGKK